jgi:hypothetical protein
MYNYPSQFGHGFAGGFALGFGLLMVSAVVWTIAWKGLALWTAARKGSKNWFVALLLINTLGILDILYIYVFSKGNAKPVEKSDKK